MEKHRVSAARERDAALVAELAGRAGNAVRERQANLVALAVDDGIDDGLPVLERRDEEPVFRRRAGEVAAGDEERRAEDLREASRLVLEGVTGRRDPAGGQLGAWLRLPAAEDRQRA